MEEEEEEEEEEVVVVVVGGNRRHVDGRGEARRRFRRRRCMGDRRAPREQRREEEKGKGERYKELRRKPTFPQFLADISLLFVMSEGGLLVALALDGNRASHWPRTVAYKGVWEACTSSSRAEIGRNQRARSLGQPFVKTWSKAIASPGGLACRQMCVLSPHSILVFLFNFCWQK